LTKFEKGITIVCDEPEFTLDLELMPLTTDVEEVNSVAREKIKELKVTHGEALERFMGRKVSSKNR
jgi:hypothetical protein